MAGAERLQKRGVVHGGLSRHRMDRLSAALQGCVERGEVAGLVALLYRRGELHAEAIGLQDGEAGTPMRRDGIFRIASMTKAVTAAAALSLVEEARLRLDDPVDRWLPELAGRRVLRSPEAPLEDTVPAHRAITLRDLLTLRAGLGLIIAPADGTPIQQAMREAGVAPGPDPLPFTADEFMRRLGTLPLAHQPGERWLYHTGYDILAVLLERAAGMPLQDLLAERLFGPLGMADTAFHVPAPKLDRLTACYRRDEAGRLAPHDAGPGGPWSRPPALPTELVTTADDYLAFARMLLEQGRSNGGRVLARPTVALMMSDHIAQAEKDASPFFPGFWQSQGWRLGGSVVTRRLDSTASVGSYGWAGGFGTAFTVDPREDLVAVLLTQCLMTGPDDMRLYRDFLALAYAAIDD